MIPKWIHQTWKSKEPDTEIDRLRQSWISAHPDFKYSFYDDHDILQFIRKYFDERVSRTYRRITNGSLKADFFRYCVLYIHGGVYVDVDLMCLRPLTEGIIDFDLDDLITATDYQERDDQPKNHMYRRDCIYQAFLCAQPFHPFIKYMINYMCFVMSNDLYKMDIFRIGGPEAFANGYDEFFKNHYPKHVVLREANNPDLKIKLVSHLHNCEYLGYNKLIFAKCQCPLNRTHTPHYNSLQFITRGVYE